MDWQSGAPKVLGFVQDFDNIDHFQANDLSRPGMVFTRVDVPFLLYSDREVELLIHDVRIKRGPDNAEPAKCQPQGFIN